MPGTPDIAAALEAAEELIESLKNYKGEGPTEHLAVLKQVDKTRALLETPFDVMSQQTEILATAGVLHVLQRTDALNKIPATGSITAEELAKAINIDVSAMKRIMRMAVCKGVAVETAPDTYAHNAMSEAYNPLGMGSFFNVAMDFVGCWVDLPEYFKTHKPEDLFDIKKSPFAYSRGKEGMTYYEVIAEDIEQREVWNVAMPSMEKNMPSSGMFPWGTLEGAVQQEPERPFIVDVGGGRGRALLKIQEEHPGTFGGKLILQDLPIVINSLKPEDIPNIELMVYDVFTPQPIKSKSLTSNIPFLMESPLGAYAIISVLTLRFQTHTFILWVTCSMISMTPSVFRY
jgi:hypothetical protein